MINTIEHLLIGRSKAEMYLRHNELVKVREQIEFDLINSDEDKSAGMTFKIQEYFGFKSDESFL